MSLTNKNVKFIITILSILTILFSSFSLSTIQASTDEFEYLADYVERANLVKLHIANRAGLEKLVEWGIDLAEHIHEHDGEGFEIDALVTDEELRFLEEQGVLENVVYTKQDWLTNLAVREMKVSEILAITSTIDSIKILNAKYFTNYSGTFLYVEAKSSAGSTASVALKASWLEGGVEKSATMSRKTDVGHYLYHTLLIPVDSIPTEVNIESSLGGYSTSSLSEWIEDGKPGNPKKHYASDFIDHYMDPTELTERIEALVSEFPDLAEIITLPYKTNGYRRQAQVTLGTLTSNAVVVTSKAWGHEGGNELSVQLVNPNEASSPLTASIEENVITVNLSTNASGAINSRAIDVVNILNSEFGDIITATTYRGNSGNGTVVTQSAQLSDYLNAPEHISREAFDVKAIRIGKHRDGSKLGVLGYSQEHAREWVTPLVTIETAERLLRNYAHDGETRKLVDNLDIFLIPSVNPDGSHYSFYDYNMQRKNMTNYCGPNEADPAYRQQWGVDLNRNHEIGSIYNGFYGASTSCRSGTYAGPEILSEPEANNLVWLADNNPNIKFGMNIHSYGGYFMWSPGAYKLNGRESLERPTAGEEAFYWAASEQILSSIKDYRGTVIVPGRTGPIPDVLYSAAGNSADTLWYNHNIYTWNFEVGADIWSPEQNRWLPTGFQPAWEEGHAEAMEFANGLMELFQVAYNFNKDKKPPKSKITPNQGKYKTPVNIQFESNEPATIFYTLDGSRPGFYSARININALREGPENLLITENTTINWFAIDAAGNIENNYNPFGNGKNYNSATITIGQ